MTYTIYHIPGIKIGVTQDMKERMRAQGFSEWEVLEVHTCIYEVSDREQELQREYGYTVDTTPYWKVVRSNQDPVARAKTSAGLKGIKRNPTREHQQKASKAGHESMKKSGVYKTMNQAKRKLTMADATEIRRLASLGEYQRSIAKKYNVAQRTITNIVNMRTYLDEKI